MTDAVRFRSDLRVEVLDDRRVFLLSEKSNRFLDDPLTAAIAASIDGSRTVADIVGKLAGTWSPVLVFSKLDTLQRMGHVTQKPSPVGEFGLRREARDAERSVVMPVDPGSRTLWVLDLRAGGSADLRGSLESVCADVGVEVRTAHATCTEPDLLVVTDDYADPRLEAINHGRIEAGAPWLLVKPRGREVWVGPRFVPGTTGCWQCAQERLSANRQVERYVASKLGWAAPSVLSSGTAPGAEGLITLAVAELLSRPSTGPTPLDGALTTLDTTLLETSKHTLVRLPQCPECGEPDQARRPTAHVQLRAGIAAQRDGGYRTCSATETLNRLQHHISPHFGAVSKVESIGPESGGLAHSFSAGHNFAMVHDNLELLRSNMRGQSGGKGRSEEQARASAVCEALERFCGVWTAQVPQVHGSYADLVGSRRVLHPNDSLLFSADQFDGRATWNSDPANRLHRVPEPFDTEAPVAFTPARSLTRGDEVLVPGGLVWFGDPDVLRHGYAVTDSNGGAAGNTLEEAVLQGLCELYERDAVGTWWYNRAQRPRVDLTSFDDPYIVDLLHYYEQLDRSVWVLDLRTDLGMPTFAAVSRRHHRVEDVMIGFGAHPEPHVALSRALTELNQFLPFVAERDSDGETRYHTDDPATLQWLRTVTVADEPWVAPAELPATTSDDLRRDIPADMRDLVRSLVDDLAARDIETLVVNQTRPDIELSVVKVIAPGLRHFWRRNAPGRLYDVPVRLGWREAPVRESDLNPWGVFF